VRPRRFFAVITDRFDHADMIENALPADAIENAEANDPIEPIESAEPIEPTDRTDPLHPMHRNESSDHRESVDRCDWTTPER